MSNKYKRPEDVPNEVLATRLDQLAEFVVKYANDLPSEFSMRVPVECDRDADVVLSVSARRLRAPSPVVMPDDVEEALAWVDEDIAADERAAEAGRREPHPLLNGQKRARTLARYIRSLSSPAPVEGDVLRKLVEVADTNPFCSVGHFVEHVAPETRAQLAALTGQAKGLTREKVDSLNEAARTSPPFRAAPKG